MVPQSCKFLHPRWLRLSLFYQRIFISPEQRRISDNPGLRLRSKDRIDILIRIVLTITAVSMLLGPSAVLYLVSGHNLSKLLLIGAFTIFFSAALHLYSKARRHENFAATSACVSLAMLLDCTPLLVLAAFYIAAIYLHVSAKKECEQSSPSFLQPSHLCRQVHKIFSITFGLVFHLGRISTPSISCFLSFILFLWYRFCASLTYFSG